MGNSLLLVEQDADAGIATGTLNCPDKRNALTAAMVQQPQDAWAEVLGNDAISVVILTATDAAFCAGMDLNTMDFGASNAGSELPRRIGMVRAKEMSLTGRMVSAQEAYEWGLVNRVVPHADLLPHVLDEAITTRFHVEDATKQFVPPDFTRYPFQAFRLRRLSTP